jgi:hypothetical protein
MMEKKVQEIYEHFNGIVYQPNSMDVVSGQLWDSVKLKPGEVFDRHVVFFHDPISRSKSLSDTNMQMCRMLPAPEAFSISRIIDNRMSFYMSFDGEQEITSPFKMWCHLEGLHARGVQ